MKIMLQECKVDLLRNLFTIDIPPSDVVLLLAREFGIKPDAVWKGYIDRENKTVTFNDWYQGTIEYTGEDFHLIEMLRELYLKAREEYCKKMRESNANGVES